MSSASASASVALVVRFRSGRASVGARQCPSECGGVGSSRGRWSALWSAEGAATGQRRRRRGGCSSAATQAYVQYRARRQRRSSTRAPLGQCSNAPMLLRRAPAASSCLLPLPPLPPFGSRLGTWSQVLHPAGAGQRRQTQRTPSDTAGARLNLPLGHASQCPCPLPLPLPLALAPGGAVRRLGSDRVCASRLAHPPAASARAGGTSAAARATLNTGTLAKHAAVAVRWWGASRAALAWRGRSVTLTAHGRSETRTQHAARRTQRTPFPALPPSARLSRSRVHKSTVPDSAGLRVYRGHSWHSGHSGHSLAAGTAGRGRLCRARMHLMCDICDVICAASSSPRRRLVLGWSASWLHLAPRALQSTARARAYRVPCAYRSSGQ